MTLWFVFAFAATGIGWCCFKVATLEATLDAMRERINLLEMEKRGTR